MPCFVYSSRIPAPVEEVFAFHERPDALDRLMPPWSRARIIGRTGGLEGGAKVRLRIPAGPFGIEWLAVHTGYQKNRYFEDIQERGPFRVWRRMFEDIPNPNFGLNYDPSHLVWQKMDYIKPLRDFASRIFHVHAKDARLDQERLDDVGLLAYPNEYHTPKLPGLGEINWGRFMSILSSTGYQGSVCVEVEDRAYEATLESRQAALYQSHRYLRQFMA